MSDQALSTKELNRRLCESRQPLKVREFIVVETKTIRKLNATETAALRTRRKLSEAFGDTTYEAKVGHANKKNLNDRIYPREVWQDNIKRLTPMLESGGLIGTDGHSSWNDTGSTSKISKKWVDLRMESDGAVYGAFQVVPTDAGKNLQVCLDAKLAAVGFSTEGYGTGHEPGDAEREEYGLTADEDACVMDRNYELEKIDSVRSPSVNDARVTAYPDPTQGQPRSAGGKEQRESRERNSLERVIDEAASLSERARAFYDDDDEPFDSFVEQLRSKSRKDEEATFAAFDAFKADPHKPVAAFDFGAGGGSLAESLAEPDDEQSFAEALAITRQQRDEETAVLIAEMNGKPATKPAMCAQGTGNPIIDNMWDRGCWDE